MSAVLSTHHLSSPHLPPKGSRTDSPILTQDAATVVANVAAAALLVAAVPALAQNAAAAVHTAAPNPADAARALALEPAPSTTGHAAVALNTLQRQPPPPEAPNGRTDVESGVAPQPSHVPQTVADCMWYLGHVMSLGSLASRYNIAAAACLVGVAQVLTMASRPIGRMNQGHTAHLLKPQNAQDWADDLWYVGHALSVCTLLSRYSIIAAVLLGVTAQGCTIASRPIGRWTPGGTRATRPAQKWADALWYFGHVISLGSMLSRYSIVAAACLAGSGQLCTMASRPWGRAAQTERGRSDDTH